MAPEEQQCGEGKSDAATKQLPAAGEQTSSRVELIRMEMETVFN